MTARLNALETTLNDRNQAVREVAEAAGLAAVEAVHAQPAQVDAAGQPIDRRAERRYDTAAKALQGVPKFRGTESWRTFESSFLTWYRINKIEQLPPDFQKRSLLTCMRGQAVEMTRPYAENTATWTRCGTLNEYVDAMRGIFLPPEESELARTEFKIRKQGRREDISTYLSAKIALWQLAYPEPERSFSTLLDETIAGIANKIVKRSLRYAAINNPEELRRQSVRFVAAERQCYREGTAESTSLDGLAATTRIADQQHDDDDDMEHDGYNAMGKFQGNCRECGTFGHKATNCYKNKNRDGGAKSSEEKKCHRCDRTGHLKSKCVARTKANGEKLREIPSKRDFSKDKGIKKKGSAKSGVRNQSEGTDDEEEAEEEGDFLGEEVDSAEEE